MESAEAVECFTKHIRGHIVFLGLDDMFCRRLMGDLELDNKKCVVYDVLEFAKEAIKKPPDSAS